MTSLLSRHRPASQGSTGRPDRSDDGGERPDQGRSSGKRNSPSGSRSSLVKNKHVIEEFIFVGVPSVVAYDQWTQYDQWSSIFKAEAAEVADDDKDTQRDGGDDDERDGGDDDERDDQQVSVRAKIGPSRRQWQTEIISQEPGRRIEWEAKGGAQAKGVTSFHRLGDRLTHLQVAIEYTPSGFIETFGNFLRMQRRRVRKDLKLFKNFVELRGEASGEGPGSVDGGGLREGVDRQVRSRGAEREESDENSDGKGRGDSDD